MKIYLIDDEPFALRLVSHQLRRLGFDDVQVQQHPRDALAFLEAEHGSIEMLLLDLQMPEIDGIEFVRHLARLGYAGALILISGEDERIVQTARRLAEAHRLDVRGALHKPVTPDSLKALFGAAAPAATKARTPGKRYDAERLAQAIANGELTNVYQPKVRLSSGEITGVETLVRWQHPDDGLVFPDQFIELAEENGLIDALTRCVLSQALHDAHAWMREGYPMHVAVNISMQSLTSLDFPDFVAHAVAAAGVPAHLLVLEVTESRLMSDVLAALDVVTRIRLKHIGLSIDDFGTGHSSLAQLRDMPFDELKVDRRFVHGAVRDSVSRAILEASLGMARQLGMRSVAEGVEDLDDWTLLREVGCDLAQGYFVGRPMPFAAFEGWRAGWEARKPVLLASDADRLLDELG
ncbi:MAG: EAL domain-containing response regulator [Gemmatimonadota bacterium]|nr:EAL domain-containing response regulator [Gemmatimonadota bacterium]